MLINSDIIVAHYNEELSWTKFSHLQNYNIYVYSKTDSNYILQSQNKGHEASAYLEHIVRHYKNLAEHNFFVHGHNESYHQDYTTDTILLNLKTPIVLKYFSLNRRDMYIQDLKHLVAWDPNINFYERLITHWPFNNIISIPEHLAFYPCAQFYVHRDLILRHSKNVYETFLDWLYTTDLDSDISGRLFEYMWNKIFTDRDTEIQVDYKAILN